VSAAEGGRGEQTRRAILQAAEECFAARGPAGASTREIAATAGVTQPLVLHYFGSKDALFREVIDGAVVRLQAAQAQALSEETDPLDFIVLGLVGLVRETGRNRRILRLTTWARLQGNVPFTPAAGRFWGEVAARFEAARSRGIVRKELDLQATLVVLDAAVKGFWERHDAYSSVGLLQGEGTGRQEGGGDGRGAQALLYLLVRGVVAPPHLAEAERRLAEALIVR
jgi:TetR/AcrR family transcriptional regulator